MKPVLRWAPLSSDEHLSCFAAIINEHLFRCDAMVRGCPSKTLLHWSHAIPGPNQSWARTVSCLRLPSWSFGTALVCLVIYRFSKTPVGTGTSASRRHRIMYYCDGRVLLIRMGWFKVWSYHIHVWKFVSRRKCSHKSSFSRILWPSVESVLKNVTNRMQAICPGSHWIYLRRQDQILCDHI